MERTYLISKPGALLLGNGLPSGRPNDVHPPAVFADGLERGTGTAESLAQAKQLRSGPVRLLRAPQAAEHAGPALHLSATGVDSESAAELFRRSCDGLFARLRQQADLRGPSDSQAPHLYDLRFPRFTATGSSARVRRATRRRDTTAAWAQAESWPGARLGARVKRCEASVGHPMVPPQ